MKVSFLTSDEWDLLLVLKHIDRIPAGACNAEALAVLVAKGLLQIKEHRKRPFVSVTDAGRKAIKGASRLATDDGHGGEVMVPRE